MEPNPVLRRAWLKLPCRIGRALNVPIGTTLTLAAALDTAGKPYELLVLPNVGHSVRTPEFHRAVRRFFLAELITREVPRATAPDAP